MAKGKFLFYSKNIYRKYTKFILKFSDKEKLEYLRNVHGNDCVKSTVIPYLSYKNIVELTQMIAKKGQAINNKYYVENDAYRDSIKIVESSENNKYDDACNTSIFSSVLLFPELSKDESYIFFGIYKNKKLSDAVGFLGSLNKKFCNVFFCFMLVNQLISKKVVKKCNSNYYVNVSEESVKYILQKIHCDGSI
ncbi:hypothetical protein BDAP_002056 [Binucleata daphniae]